MGSLRLSLKCDGFSLFVMFLSISVKSVFKNLSSEWLNKIPCEHNLDEDLFILSCLNTSHDLQLQKSVRVNYPLNKEFC